MTKFFEIERYGKAKQCPWAHYGVICHVIGGGKWYKKVNYFILFSKKILANLFRKYVRREIHKNVLACTFLMNKGLRKAVDIITSFFFQFIIYFLLGILLF